MERKKGSYVTSRAESPWRPPTAHARSTLAFHRTWIPPYWAPRLGCPKPPSGPCSRLDNPGSSLMQSDIDAQLNNFFEDAPSREFDVVLRGYDRHQVHDHLKQLDTDLRQAREQVGSLQRDLSDSQRQLQEQEASDVIRASAPGSSSSFVSRKSRPPSWCRPHGRRPTRSRRPPRSTPPTLRAAAENEAAEKRALATREADEMRTAAERDAEEIRGTAKRETDELTNTTEREIAKQRATADHEVAEKRADAEREIAKLRTTTEREVAQLRASTKRERDEILTTAKRQADEMRAQAQRVLEESEAKRAQDEGRVRDPARQPPRRRRAPGGRASRDRSGQHPEARRRGRAARGHRRTARHQGHPAGRADPARGRHHAKQLLANARKNALTSWSPRRKTSAESITTDCEERGRAHPQLDAAPGRRARPVSATASPATSPSSASSSAAPPPGHGAGARARRGRAGQARPVGGSSHRAPQARAEAGRGPSRPRPTTMRSGGRSKPLRRIDLEANGHTQQSPAGDPPGFSVSIVLSSR